MLGRYVGGTLVILGVAMLMAPDGGSEDTPTAEADTADAAAPETVAPEVVSRAGRAPAAPDAGLASDQTAAVATGIGDARAGRDGRAPARLDAAEEATRRNGPALGEPVEGGLAELAAHGTAVDEAAPVPTLSQPETLRMASITDETQALIARAEEGPPAGAATAEGDESDLLYVSGSWVNVRSGPSTEFGVITALPRGEAVELVADAGSGWARVRMDQGQEGFMSMSFLAEEPAGG
jgi:hypothetical protein